MSLPNKIFARDVHTIPFHDVNLHDDTTIHEMRTNIKAGDSYIFTGASNRQQLQPIREYLIKIGQNSLPNYQAIERGAPNFHRINDMDPRAYVKGCFHQFSFFPWNQDVFNFFTQFQKIYYLKNRLSCLPADIFLKQEPEKDCIARLSFQFYPVGGGVLNSHADPFDHHQLTVPVMMMSKKGEDFQHGGGYVMTPDQQKILLDDICDWGDVTFFNAQVVHGVAEIDPEKPRHWLDFEGRWIMLFAVNKLAGNTAISNSVDFETK